MAMVYGAWHGDGGFIAQGLVQFVYCMVVGTFPFNSFLAGFFSSVGTAILLVCLRIQVHPENKYAITVERAYADFVLCNVVLHLVVVNFMG